MYRSRCRFHESPFAPYPLDMEKYYHDIWVILEVLQSIGKPDITGIAQVDELPCRFWMASVEVGLSDQSNGYPLQHKGCEASNEVVEGIGRAPSVWA